MNIYWHHYLPKPLIKGLGSPYFRSTGSCYRSGSRWNEESEESHGDGSASMRARVCSVLGARGAAPSRVRPPRAAPAWPPTARHRPRARRAPGARVPGTYARRRAWRGVEPSSRTGPHLSPGHGVSRIGPNSANVSAQRSSS